MPEVYRVVTSYDMCTFVFSHSNNPAHYHEGCVTSILAVSAQLTHHLAVPAAGLSMASYPADFTLSPSKEVWVVTLYCFIAQRGHHYPLSITQLVNTNCI